MTLAEAEARLRRWIALARGVAARAPRTSWRERLGLAPRASGDARDGRPVGTWTIRLRGGGLVRGAFESGEPHGEWCEHDEAGACPIRADFAHGTCRRVTTSSVDAHGVRTTEAYVDGALVRSVRESRSGLHEGGEWKNGLRSGEWIFHGEDGAIDDERSGRYVAGERVAPASFFVRYVGARADSARARVARELVRANASAEPAGIHDEMLLAMAQDAAHEVRTIVADAASEALARTSALELERHVARILLIAGARAPDEDRLARFRAVVVRDGKPPALSLPFLAVASFDGSGYVREAAVDALARVTIGAELGFLLLRTSDWVAPVRARAEAAVAARATEAYAEPFARELATLEALTARERSRGSTVLAHAADVWSTPAGTRALRARFGSRVRVLRRAAVRHALEHGIDPAESAELALVSDDAHVRLHAARARITRVGVAERMSVFARLFRDPAMPVRREALRADGARAAGDRAIALETALLDPHRAIRELARFLASESTPRFDARGFYEHALGSSDARTRTAAFAGLAAIVDAKERAALFDRAERDGPRSLEGVLDAARPGELSVDVTRVWTWLASDRASLSRAAARHLAARGVDDAELAAAIAIARAPAHPHVARNLVRVARAAARWSALVLLLAALEPDPAPAPAAVEAGLEEWLARRNKSFAAPRAKELDRVRALHARTAARVPERLRAPLDELLASTAASS